MGKAIGWWYTPVAGLYHDTWYSPATGVYHHLRVFRGVVEIIYLDNAATTFPKPECVYKAVDDFNRNSAVNAGRGSYAAARDASQMILDVKAQILELCNANDIASVFMAPSTTIALNQIINGQRWQEGANAYVTLYEHNSVMRPIMLMRERYGINIRVIPHVKGDLSIDLEKTEAMFEKYPPSFVAVNACSNVTGYILPAREIFGLAKRYGAFTLLDAAQAFGLIELDFATLNADAVAYAGHKTLYSTFGTAGAVLRDGVELDAFLAGGNGIKSMELTMPESIPEKLEAGSMDTPAIAGLAASLAWLKTVDVLGHEKELMARLIDGLSQIPEIKLYKAPGGMENQGSVMSFNLGDVNANAVGQILDDEHDIAVRVGHHCVSALHPYLKDLDNRGTVRVSVGYFNTNEDIDALIEAVRKMDIKKLKAIRVRREAC